MNPRKIFGKQDMPRNSKLYNQHSVVIPFLMGRPEGRAIPFLGVLIGEQVVQEVQGAFAHDPFFVHNVSFDYENLVQS